MRDRVNERLTSNFIPFKKLNFYRFTWNCRRHKGDNFCSCGMGSSMEPLLRKKKIVGENYLKKI